MRGVKARAAIALCGAVLGIAVASADDEWPRFRGSNGGVAADHPSLPDQWGPAQNIVWKIDVPGRSWSSPVIWGDHVFVTTAINTLETESLLPARLIRLALEWRDDDLHGRVEAIGPASLGPV